MYNINKNHLKMVYLVSNKKSNVEKFFLAYYENKSWSID